MHTTRGHVTAIARFPVKSLLGEGLGSAVVDHRGLVGDRLWAVRDVDGKFGSGKSTRRFRRMPGLLELTAGYGRDFTPLVRFPDGRSISAADPGIHDALSTHVGRAVTLAREAEVSHFDEGALHLVTTTSSARLTEVHGAPVDLRRLRANLLIDTGAAPRFDEDDWVGRTLAIGADIVVRVRKPMVRCIMVDLPQSDLAADGHLLDTLGRVNDTKLGLVVDVVAPGTVQLGDTVQATSGA